MSMSNQSQTERTRVIMIPSAIYSFKTTVKTSSLQTILQRRDIRINNKTALFKKNKIRNYNRDKKTETSVVNTNVSIFINVTCVLNCHNC